MVNDLYNSLEFKREVEEVDLTTSKMTATRLTETKVECLVDEKDYYVYYFVLRYPSRTLIFVNSIDCLRRLSSLLHSLEVECLTLHADMQQRQRLKNMDRLRNNPKAVMVCTDVAARGLDVPEVEHVIHYQVPRTSELYVHRSGRSARGANGEGLSLLLIGEKERDSYKKIMYVLDRSDDLEPFPVTAHYLLAVRERVKLARRLDKAQHKQNRAASQEGWLKKMAEEADLDIDDDLELEIDEKKTKKKEKTEVEQMRRELKALLKQPLFPKGTFSPRYPTLGTMDPLNNKLEQKSALTAMSR